ncbi:MAG: Gfo/Idh/MocA family oxidoreductase [Gemmatimonadetes bacterium]|nr:Gfo/Idh/MocA family oxidoreductase [Gemmatimonadota bacterium]
MTETSSQAAGTDSRTYPAYQLVVLVALRWLVGWHLLYEGVAKLVNPYWTSADYLARAHWIFQDWFHSLAASPGTLSVVDFLNVWGLILIGLGLLLGAFTRVATVFGIVLLGLYYVVDPPFAGAAAAGPSEGSYLIVNKTLVELAVLVALFVFPTAHRVGLDRWIGRWAARLAGPRDAAAPAGATLTRRDLIQVLASLPVVGVLVYAILKKQAQDNARRAAIMAELRVSESGPAVIPEAVSRPPSRRVRLGVIGFGGEGESLVRSVGFAHPDWVTDATKAQAEDPRDTQLKDFLTQEDLNVDIVAVCDTFTVRAERGVAASTNDTRPGGGSRPLASAKIYRRYDELIASPDVDAVIIATPDHWHSRMGIAAARAGRHIYLEKAMTRTADEAIALRDALRATPSVVFQLGHQNRQAEAHMKAKEVVDAGILGAVTLVETTTNRNDAWGAWVWEIHKQGSPETIDWEHFQEPAPHKVPFSLERFFRWRCWCDYGTGLSGDLLSHEYDGVNQILGLGIPKSAVASGGIYFFKDGRDVPDVFQVALEYPGRDLTLVYSATLANGRNRGMVFMGHDASMQVGTGVVVMADPSSTRYKEKLERKVIDPCLPLFTYRPGFKGLDAVTSATEEYFVSRGLLWTYRGGQRVNAYHLHLKEWLTAIRDGGKTSCDIERGFEEAITCHMATAAYLTGRRMAWDPVRERIV